MHIPIYVVTGFLDSGKTTLLNKLLNSRYLRAAKLLLIQFESGEEAFESRNPHCQVINFSKRALEQNPSQVVREIHGHITKNAAQEIWIEWNGVTPFAQLQELFLHPSLYRLCRIEKVVHMIDASMLEGLLGRTGGALPEQIANCDLAVVRGIKGDYSRVRRAVRNINPGIKLLRVSQTDSIFKEISCGRKSPVNMFCIGILLFVNLYLLSAYFLNLNQTPVNTIINVYLGIILQAVPFLLIGVLISSVIQVFISTEAIERRFPKNTVLGMLAALVLGFCLPVCDCASIPVFRSLVRKGVPLSAAVTFMTAAPVINPVVMLSTYYAFGGSIQIVAARVGLGVVSAVLIGLWFSLRPQGANVLPGRFGGLMCSCGCYEDPDSVTTFQGKLGLFLRHSQAEFFDVGKYLMIGAFVAALMQTVMKNVAFQSGLDFAAALFVMMALAFLLSLCSSSDAVIARSLASNFPLGAVMGFLVFGPMIDIKNVIMLSGGFSKRFVVSLVVVAFTVCFIVVFLLGRIVAGG